MLLPYSLLFISGLVFGSFVAALTYRLPRGLQNIKGRSFCDNCKTKVEWYDNIPLFSYLFLRGRCRKCNNKISLRYPIIELLTAIGFILIGVNIFWLLMFLVLEAIFITDFEHQIIPDELVWTGIGLQILNLKLEILNSLLAGMLCASILLCLHLLTRGRGMGLGDVKFAILGGMLVGLSISIYWLMLSFLTGAIVSVILILWGSKKLKEKIAFGPFLIISIPLSLWLSSLSWFRSFLFW